MKKCVENLATSKLTGGRRHPLRIRRKYEIDRYPNEPIQGTQESIARKVRGKAQKTALKTADFVNLSTKVLENPTNNDYQRSCNYQRCTIRNQRGKMQSCFKTTVLEARLYLVALNDGSFTQFTLSSRLPAFLESILLK